ncbi:MAG: hypothetical protein ACREJ9_13915 [Candidatus Rokuibacteriota bacterium]
MTLEEIRDCVKKTIDECLVQILVDRPATELSQHQRLQLLSLIDDLSRLFLDVRLRRS